MKSYSKSSYYYTKLRKNFGKQPLFQMVPAHMLDSINPNKEDQKDYILRNPVHREVQATLPQSEHDSNTKRIIMTEQSINHTEGGWPRDVHLYNEEHLARHRRRVQHEDNYVHSVLKVQPHIEHFIDQNNAIDMYQNYFHEMTPQPPVENYKVQIANIFRDKFTRPVSSIVWTSEKNSKLVVSYSYKTYPTQTNADQEKVCYIWDINNQTEPMYEFIPKHSCWQVACSQTESDLLIGGLDNGTVNVFDIRQGSHCIGSSSIYNSHLAPITALLFNHSRTNTEFFTGSPDGQCLWWDLRNLSAPLTQLPMSVRFASDQTPNLTNSEGVSSLEFDRGLPTKFLCGTESGLVINANRLGRSHSEILTCYWEAHSGPVRAVHRSPCTLRMFITCGDWSVRIWSEEVRSAPIIMSPPYRYQVTDVIWAPLRYSAYMAVADDGVFYYWDLLRKHKQPIATLRVSNSGLTKVSPHWEGELIVVGDKEGSIYLLHLSDNMTIPGSNDKQLMHQTYDRETRREHIIDSRVKELRLKARAEEEQVIQLDENSDEEEFEKVSVEYFNIVKDEMSKMGGLFDNNSMLVE